MREYAGTKASPLGVSIALCSTCLDSRRRGASLARNGDETTIGAKSEKIVENNPDVTWFNVNPGSQHHYQAQRPKGLRWHQ